jgi:UDP-N-acetylglucosamine 1-carboxyvinyltransferase
VLRPWRTIIKLWAIEPHVTNLIAFLKKAWADIKVKYNHEIVINWVKKLDNDFEFDIVADYIEAWTYMIIWALASEEYIDIVNARIEDLYFFIEKLKEAWVKVRNLWKDTLRVYKAKKLNWVQIQTNIFPWFPTDLQSPFAILMSQSKWISKIHEVLFEWRLNFLVELEKMWANVAMMNPHEALIFWPNVLKWWATVTSWDLRAGAAMVIAWLITEWETRITNIKYIYRWYEDFVKKLKKLWADVREV